MRHGTRIAIIVLTTTALSPHLGCGDDDDRAEFFSRTDLVSSIDGRAATFDPNLIDPWGIAAGPETFLWVANRGSGTATVYNEQGQRVFLQQGDQVSTQFVVQIPAAPDPGLPGRPTDVIFNPTDEFEVRLGDDREASEFLFATEDGTIAGWGDDLVLDAGPVLDSGGASSFSALALPRRSDLRLYAVDFLQGRVQVLDEDLEPDHDLAPAAFVDPELAPDLVPFGIASINGDIYVSYVRRDGNRLGALPGSGAVTVFDDDGEVQWRLDPAFLDAPYAIVEAPDDFGPFSDAVLVGNTGDGTIDAFDEDSGVHLGALTDEGGQPIVIDGLRDLFFGRGNGSGDTDQLFFTATLDDGAAGLFGRLEEAPVRDL
jgi:uncharacterized protein (TIGR03118 family)